MATQVSRASRSTSTPGVAPKPLDADGQGQRMHKQMKGEDAKTIQTGGTVATSTVTTGCAIASLCAPPAAGVIMGGGTVANGVITAGTGSAAGATAEDETMIATAVGSGAAISAGGAYGIAGEGQGLDNLAKADKAAKAARAAKDAEAAAKAAKAAEAVKGAKDAGDIGKAAKDAGDTADTVKVVKDVKKAGDSVAEAGKPGGGTPKDKPRHDKPAPQTLDAHDRALPREGGPPSRRALDASGAHDGRTASLTPVEAPLAAPAAPPPTAPSTPPPDSTPGPVVARARVGGTPDAARP